MERHKGFTLLEILVALLIMSLLAGIALQSYQHALMTVSYTHLTLPTKA